MKPAIVFTYLFIFSLSIFCSSLMAQQTNTEKDSLRQITVDEVVITANRYNNKILNTGASVEVIRAGEINNLPIRNFSDVLGFVPGLYMASTDGMGLNPQISLRGFYGGGEAEYLTVLIDGIPVNDLETGLANWNQLPINQINQVELLKGGSSTLYGDAAMGGVLNIRTVKKDAVYTHANIGYGSYNTYNIGASHGGNLGKGTYEIYANNSATDGFRDHSTWKSINFGGKVKLPVSKNSTLAFSTYNQILDSEEPGYLTASDTENDRKQSLPLFIDDGKDFQKYLANLSLNSKVNKNADLGINLSYQHKNTDQTRTFGQYPNILISSGGNIYPNGLYDTTLYGNTKNRALTTDQINLAIRIVSRIPEIGATISGGIETDYGAYQNEYRDIFKGFENDYANNYQPWDSLDTKGGGYRWKSAAYINGEIKLAQPLTLLAGIRYDLISDDFEGDLPDTTFSKNNSALSPNIALNLSTGETNNYAGSIYLSYSHAFKAPTIDQRTDYKQLHYFVFFEAGPSYIPMEIKANPFSNPDLKPQKSINYELGTYQYYKFSDNLSGEINIAGYFISVKDEIDFDLMTQQYKNIIDTEHTGLETSIRLNIKQNWSGFLSYTFAEVKFANGDIKGNFLKGIPKNVYMAGFSYAPQKGLGGTLVLNGANGIYLDDENTEELDGFAVLNARLDYRLDFATIFFDVNNIFNTYYYSTGYLLDGEKYLYPAMGRFLKVGVNFSF